MIKLFHDKVFCCTESLINVYINMHPIFPFIIDVSRVYSDYSDQVFGLKHCEQCLFKFHSESFSQIWFCLIRIAKNENIWFIITSHSSSCNVLPPSPHSISDKHRPRCGLTFSSITMSGGCFMRSVAAKQNHKKSHQTRADEIPVCLLSSVCLTAPSNTLIYMSVAARF